MLNGYNFSLRHGGITDVEKFILSTSEYQECYARLIALSLFDEPITFYIDRKDYIFEVEITQMDGFNMGNLQENINLKINLYMNISLFDTEKVICIPSSLNSYKIVGNTRETPFKNKSIGGMYFNDTEDIYVEKFAFDGLTIRTPFVFGLCHFIDEHGEKFTMVDVYKNCTLCKSRGLYKDSLSSLESNGNKILSISVVKMSVPMYSLNVSEMIDDISKYTYVKHWDVSIYGIHTNLANFNYSDLCKVIMDKSNEFIDKYNLKDTTVSITYVPGLLSNYQKMDKSVLTGILDSLNQNDKGIIFAYYG